MVSKVPGVRLSFRSADILPRHRPATQGFVVGNTCLERCGAGAEEAKTGGVLIVLSPLAEALEVQGSGIHLDIRDP